MTTMRVDICTTEDEGAKAALLAALAAVGASREDGADPEDDAFGQGLHRFRTAAGATLTVFADAWGVDLEGPDDLVNRVLAVMAG
jgi:hypothetical protein